MKNNYNIKLNPKRLTSEEIARHQDFDVLLSQFEKEQAKPRPQPTAKIRPMYFYLGAAAAAMLGLLVYFVGDTGNYAQESAEYFAAQEFVNAPLATAKPQFASYKINANQGGVYEYRSGSRVVVPAEAFVNDKGELIEGEIEIKYREFHDFVDFFLSGIPMTYDSAGTTYTLESAGMMEIYAEKDGQKVRMAPGKTIDVELVSAINAPAHLNVPPDYNIYKLDSEKRNWIYQNLDEMEWMKKEEITILDKKDPLYEVKKNHADRLSALELKEATELAKIDANEPQPEAPKKPKKAVQSDYVFALDYSGLMDAIDERFLSETEKTEVAAAEKDLKILYREYQQMLWKISPKSNISPERFRQQYSEVDGNSIKKLSDWEYEFTLFKDNSATKIIVNPVLTGRDYERAMQVFQEELAIYEQKIEARTALLKNKKEGVQNRIAEERRLEEEDYQKRLAAHQQNGQHQQAIEHIVKRRVVNRFKATEMGIWNCDRPIPPSEQRFKANFVDASGKNFNNRTAYLVDKSRNTVKQFYTTEKTPLNFNKNSENLLWLLTEENKIAVFRPEDFKRVNQPKGSYEFELTVIDKEIKSEADVREVLYF